MKCVSLTVVFLFGVQKLSLANNLDDLQSRFPMRYASDVFSLECKPDETLIVGRFKNATTPMYFFVCGHNNPCGSSLNCVLTRSDSCASPGEYTSSLSKEIFGITSICCKYDLTATNLDEHCEVTTIQANSTLTITGDAIHDQPPHQPTEPTPNVNDKDGPTKGKDGQGNATPKPKPSSGNGKKTIEVPVKMYIADVDPTLVAVNDRAVKSILKQSNGEWQVTICTLTCRKSTTRQPDSNSEDDNNNVADKTNDGSHNFDSSQEYDRSSQSDSSQIGNDPCDVNGEELQALLPNKIRGFNGGQCTHDVGACKIKCLTIHGSEYLSGVCRNIRGSGCQKKICLCVTKKHNKDQESEDADIAGTSMELDDHSKSRTKPHSEISKSKSNQDNGSKSMSESKSDSSKTNSKSKTDTSRTKSKSRSGSLKSMSKQKSDNSKTKSKSKKDSSKTMSKSKSDSSKTKSKSKKDSLMTMSKSKSDSSKSMSNSKSDSSKTKSKLKKDSSKTMSKAKSDTSKTMSNSKSDSSKTKSKSKKDSSMTMSNSKSDSSKTKSKSRSGSLKSMSKQKSDNSKTKSKSKKDSSKTMSKSKSDSSKTKSKSKKDSSMTMSKSKSDSSKSKSKSKSDSSKSMSNSKSDGSKTTSKSKSDSSNSKSKSKSYNSNAKSKSKSGSSKSNSKSVSDRSKSESMSKSQNSVESKSQSQSMESEIDGEEQQAIAQPKPSATCFSRDTIVTTRNGPVRMDKLSKGTEVLVRREMGLIAVFQPIQWFIHRDSSKVTKFIDISDDRGHNVTLSPNHLIPIGDCLDTTYQHDEIMFRKSIFAKYAKIDMCMFISDNNSVIKQTKIIQIRNSVKTGIYSPITASGSLIVNEGVLVSCYSQFQNQLLQQTMFNILNNFFGLFDSSSMSDTTIDVPLLIRYMNYFAALVSL